MRSWLLLALLLVACGNRGSVSVPRGKPTLRLVRCAAAVPRPQPNSELEEAVSTIRERAGRRGFGYPAQPNKRLVVGKKPTVTIGTITTLGALTSAEATGPLINPWWFMLPDATRL